MESSSSTTLLYYRESVTFLWSLLWSVYKIGRPRIGAESDLFIHMITLNIDRTGWDEVQLYQPVTYSQKITVKGQTLLVMNNFCLPFYLINVIFYWVTPTVSKRFEVVDVQ